MIESNSGEVMSQKSTELHSLNYEQLKSKFLEYEQSNPEEVTEILDLIIDRAFNLEEWDSAVQWCTVLVKHCNIFDLPEDGGFAQYNLGMALESLDRFTEADEAYAAAVNTFQSHGNEVMALEIILVRCKYHQLNAIWDEAILLGDEAIRVASVIQDFFSAGKAALMLSELYDAVSEKVIGWVDSDAQSIAIDYSEQAFSFFENCGDVKYMALSKFRQSKLLKEKGNFGSSLNQIVIAIEMFNANNSFELSDQIELSDMYLVQAELLHSIGRDSDAEVSVLLAIHFAELCDSRYFQNQGQILYAEILTSQSHFDLATSRYNLVKDFLLPEKDSTDYQTTIIGSIRVLFYSGDLQRCINECKIVIRDFEVEETPIFISVFYVEALTYLSLCFLELELFNECLETLFKIQNRSDLILEMHRAVLVDVIRAQALYCLDQNDEALVICNNILDFDFASDLALTCEIFIKDQSLSSIFRALILRWNILKESDEALASSDLKVIEFMRGLIK